MDVRRLAATKPSSSKECANEDDFRKRFLCAQGGRLSNHGKLIKRRGDSRNFPRMESAGRTEISQLSRDATHDTSSPIFTSQLSRVQRSRCHFYHRAISPSFSSICRHLSTPSRSRRNFSNLSYIISPSFLVSNAIQVASIFSPLKGRRL